MVHGLLDTASSFKKMARFLEAHGFQTHTFDLKPNTGRNGIDELALSLKEYVNEHLDPDELFSLVGFSMGGLVCRYYLQRLGGLSRVKRFIAISTPHYGSWLAYAVPNKGCKQMRPNCEFLRDLNKTMNELKRIHVASLWTPFDLMIVPTRNSRLPIGEEIKLPVPIHRLMITNKRCIEIVLQFLNGRKFRSTYIT